MVVIIQWLLLASWWKSKFLSQWLFKKIYFAPSPPEPVTFNVLCDLILPVLFFPPSFQNAFCYPLFIALFSAFFCIILSHCLFLCGKILPILKFSDVNVFSLILPAGSVSPVSCILADIKHRVCTLDLIGIDQWCLPFCFEIGKMQS